MLLSTSCANAQKSVTDVSTRNLLIFKQNNFCLQEKNSVFYTLNLCSTHIYSVTFHHVCIMV